MKQEQILEIIENQRRFFSSGVTLDVNYRIAALKKLQHALKVQEAAIAQAIHADLGKSPEESYMCETGIVLAEINYMLKHIKKISELSPPAAALAVAVSMTVSFILQPPTWDSAA